MKISCVARKSEDCKGDTMLGGEFEFVPSVNKENDDFITAIKKEYSANDFGLRPICVECLHSMMDDEKYYGVVASSILTDGFAKRIK